MNAGGRMLSAGGGRSRMRLGSRLAAAACALGAIGAWAGPAHAETNLALTGGADRVERFAPIEWTLDTDAAPANPCDPCEIDLRVELTAPSGRRIVVPAFFYQPCERRQQARGGKPAEWIYPAGPAVWKARFSPDEAGRWTAAAAAMQDPPAPSARSTEVRFECTPSKRRGFVRVSRRDPRFFELDDGRPFFPVGQNVAFVYDSYRAIDMLRQLGRNGGNFARVWACCEDWAMAIEARRSGWGRSWAWDPPIVRMPGREGFHSEDLCVGLRGEADTVLTFSPTRPLAVRPATKYRLTGQARTDTGAGFLLDPGGGKTELLKCAKGKWTPFRCELTTGETQWWLDRLSFRSLARCTMYLRDLSLREAGGGPELLTEADVNRPLRGRYNQIDAFMLDRLVEAAEAAGVHLQLVMLTRDHYMPLLRKADSPEYDRALRDAKALVRYFVARWGFSTHVAAWEYFNEMDPHRPTDRFYAELGEYLQRVDPYRHVRATSAWASPSRDYGLTSLDQADMHWYMRPASGELRKDAAAGVLERAKVLRERAPGKPALLSEFGMTDDTWQRSGDLDTDKEFVHLHNALWASALSGMSGTACHWYWDDIHKRDLYHHYAGVAAFVADIPFTTAKLRPAEAKCDKPLRVVGLAGKGGAWLWLADPNATWWALAAEGAKPAELRGATLTVSGLRDGAWRVEWWDTRSGKVLHRLDAAAAGRALAVAVPAFSRDIACKVLPAGK